MRRRSQEAAPVQTAPRRALAQAARAAGVPKRLDRAFLDDLEAELTQRPGARVAVLFRPPDDALCRAIAACFPGARVTGYDTSVPESDLHVRLAADGWFDVIVEDSRTPRVRGAVLRRVFFHLDRGGVLLVPDARQGGLKPSAPGEERLSEVLAAVLRLRLSAKGRPKRRWHNARGDNRQLANAVGTLNVARTHLALTNRVRVQAKLREEEVDGFLAARGPKSGRVLTTRPAQRFESRATLCESPSPRAGGFPTGYDVPQVALREYRNVLCTPGQVVTQRNVMLPDTFRHNQSRRLLNLYAEDFGPRFARPLHRAPRPERLDGAYFYLDSEFRGHFGHAITEQLSRLWAWQQAKAQLPDLRVVTALNKDRELAAFELDLYAAAGIPREDIVLVRGPVRVDRLVAATPMLSQPAYVHPDLRETWAAVGAALAAGAPDRDYPDRIFCARRPGKRGCLNAPEVEDYFRRHGFAVVFPEDYSLAEQVRMFRAAEVVAGYAGSAMFTLNLSGAPKHSIVITPESYRAQNEYVIAAVVGHRIDVAWCRTEQQTAGQHGAFTFDFEREGRFVDEVLGQL
jgi:capsular polysaccharide biosynthesis protein